MSKKFAQDMEKITNYYQNNGYFNFRILDTDIQTNEDKTKQTIKVTVSEGDRFRWAMYASKAIRWKCRKKIWKNC